MAKHHRLTIETVRKALGFSQPLLQFFEDDDAIYAKGEYIVSDAPHPDGPLTKFDIGCIFHRNYPEQEPIVFEFGETIERVAERHMYISGRCCTCVWSEWLAKSADTSVRAFCDGPLYNFFLSQVVFDHTGEWPFGERSHGAKGIAEGIASAIGLELTEAQANSYALALAAKKVKGHWPCPCGSGRKLRNCHFEQVMQLRQRVGREAASALQKDLRKQIKAETSI